MNSLEQSTTPTRRSPASGGSVWQPAALYKRQPGTWWKGRRIKLDREIRTVGGDVFRKGRIVKVARKYRGLTLEGKNLHVSRVGLHGLSVDATPNAGTHAPATKNL